MPNLHLEAEGYTEGGFWSDHVKGKFDINFVDAKMRLYYVYEVSLLRKLYQCIVIKLPHKDRIQTQP